MSRKRMKSGPDNLDIPGHYRCRTNWMVTPPRRRPYVLEPGEEGPGGAGSSVFGTELVHPGQASLIHVINARRLQKGRRWRFFGFLKKSYDPLFSIQIDPAKAIRLGLVGDAE